MSDQLRAALEELRQEHLIVEDCWYSCPKSSEGCCDERNGSDCNCGADKHNAKLDAIIAALAAQPPADVAAELRAAVTNPATVQQPEPRSGGRRVSDMVLSDVRERVELGIERYGRALETHNGRDPLIDAYQEAIDLVMYLRQEIAERAQPTPPPPADVAAAELRAVLEVAIERLEIEGRDSQDVIDRGHAILRVTAPTVTP